jgi:hypothetical protein
MDFEVTSPELFNPLTVFHDIAASADNGVETSAIALKIG